MSNVFARIGMVALLALVLLMQTVSARSAMSMTPGMPTGNSHLEYACEGISGCDGTEVQALDCCADEIEQHCASGLCSVAALCLPVSLTPLVPLNAAGLGASIQHFMTTVIPPPLPPPKAVVSIS
ncbi:hypothetical protein ADIMK_3826 [Marinobacterium lacunae]|uniref:Uncharacterized protein n=1 Tax=Marinobacterium lacunae TaxID=1232683 RepID=A0A081FUG0_9GAMM|nr:hypothetical protein [Marinobacterium lacunae]KEA62165.1 hypothetical protein ADIMK_3826 [Marinobacterium lacunae]